MRSALRDDFLLVKRPTGLTRLLKSTKWQKCPIVLFQEENTFWLIVFTDKSTSLSFFNLSPANSEMKLSASELLTVLRTSNPSSQNAPLVRSVIELIPLCQIISLESCTKSTKGQQNGISEANELIYCLTIEYLTSTSSSSEKQRRIHFGSMEHNSIIEWLTVIEQKRVISRSSAASSSVIPTPQSRDTNSIYCPAFQDNIFPVKLLQFPEGCTAYNFRTNARYRLEVDTNAITLLGANETASAIVSWPLTLVRGFGKPTGSRCDKFWFEAGRRCPTGVGVFSFESSQAVRLYELAHQQVSRFNQRMLRVNSAPPSYTDVMRDCSITTETTSSSSATEGTQEAAPPPLPPPKNKSLQSSKPQASRNSTALHTTPSTTLPSRAGVPLPPVPFIAPLYPTNLLNSIAENHSRSSPASTPPVLTTPPLLPSAPPPPMYESGQSFVLLSDTTDKQCVTEASASKVSINDVLTQLTNVLRSTSREQRPAAQTTSSRDVLQSVASPEADNYDALSGGATFNGREEHVVKPMLNNVSNHSAPSSPQPLSPETCPASPSNHLSSCSAAVLFRQPSETPAAMHYDDDDASSYTSNEWTFPTETTLPTATSSNASNTATDANQSNAGVYVIASQWQGKSAAHTSEITNFDLIQFHGSAPVPAAPNGAHKTDAADSCASFDSNSSGPTAQVVPTFRTTLNHEQMQRPPIPQRPPNMKLPAKLPR